MWRPARRLDARRYVREPCSLCEGTSGLYPTAPRGARENMKNQSQRQKILIDTVFSRKARRSWTWTKRKRPRRPMLHGHDTCGPQLRSSDSRAPCGSPAPCAPRGPRYLCTAAICRHLDLVLPPNHVDFPPNQDNLAANRPRSYVPPPSCPRDNSAFPTLHLNVSHADGTIFPCRGRTEATPRVSRSRDGIFTCADARIATSSFACGDERRFPCPRPGEPPRTGASA